jgi:hypothetical protein
VFELLSPSFPHIEIEPQIPGGDMHRRSVAVVPSPSEKGLEMVMRLGRLWDNGFELKVRSVNTQRAFLDLCLSEDIVVVDGSIEEGMGNVYEIATENAKSLAHVLVVSRTPLPVNFLGLIGGGAPAYPRPEPHPNGEQTKNWSNEDIIDWLRVTIPTIPEHPKYTLSDTENMEQLQEFSQATMELTQKSLEHVKRLEVVPERVFISYRKSEKERADKLADMLNGGEFHGKSKREVVLLTPGELAYENELLSQMRRWQIMGLLDDKISTCGEFWIVDSKDYSSSWWTVGELICASRLVSEGKNLKIMVWNKGTDAQPLDCKFSFEVTEEQQRKLARFFVNTRPDQMAPENVQALQLMGNFMDNSLDPGKRISGLLKHPAFASGMQQMMAMENPEIANLETSQFNELLDNMIQSQESSELQAFAQDFQQGYFEAMKEFLKSPLFDTMYGSVWASMEDKFDHEPGTMIQQIKEMTEEAKFKEYLNDPVFQKPFWEDLLFEDPEHIAPYTQKTDPRIIDVNRFLAAPGEEMERVTPKRLTGSVEDGSLLKSKSKHKYRIQSYKPRVLWHPGRLEMMRGGLEEIPVYLFEKLS